MHAASRHADDSVVSPATERGGTAKTEGILPLRLTIAIGAVVLASATAQAQEWPRVTVFGGVQIADFGTDVEVEGETDVLEETIDFEEVPGFHERASVVRAAGLWRLSRRNHVAVKWNRVDREVVHHQLPVDITFGDGMFVANVDAFAVARRRCELFVQQALGERGRRPNPFTSTAARRSWVVQASR
jgi:hypothetical protein